VQPPHRNAKNEALAKQYSALPNKLSAD